MKTIQILAVLLIGTFFGISQANAWDFRSGETFDGKRICKLLSVDDYEQVVFGLINGQVTLASARPLNVVMQNGQPDVERGYGMRMGDQFFQGTIHHDPRQSNTPVVVSQMFMGEYGKAFNDRFASQDTIKIKTVLGRKALGRTYNLEGLHDLYPQYRECMGW